MSEIEKQFFETFGIEPRDNFKGCENGIAFYTYGCNIPSCRGCLKEIRKKEYPQITDRILLELICILSKHQKDRGSLLEICEISLDEIKEEILEMLIYRVDGCKHQVQALFKEDN